MRLSSFLYGLAGILLGTIVGPVLAVITSGMIMLVFMIIIRVISQTEVTATQIPGLSLGFKLWMGSVIIATMVALMRLGQETARSTNNESLARPLLACLATVILLLIAINRGLWSYMWNILFVLQ